MYILHALGIPNFLVFCALYLVHLLITPPRQTISPLSVLYGYYGLWFVLAPVFAQQYQGPVLYTPEYTLAFVMAYAVFGIGIMSLRCGENLGLRHAESTVRYESHSPPISDETSLRHVRRWIFALYMIATFAVAMVVMRSGGLENWLEDPGNAFLNRGGSGVYVILSHFSAFALAALSGYYSCIRKNWGAVTAYLLWLVATSPVHGSKLQIALLAIIALIPWLSKLRPFTFKSAILYAALTAVFFLGMYFRGVLWQDLAYKMPLVLNYFSALQNLAMSIRDFDPSLLQTFFLPFVKFQTPFGLAEPTMYFDMNHMLTDHYYPEKWAIRATEQWPVETDLYLNFFFVGGLPLVAAYLALVGYLHGRACATRTLGWLFVSTLMSLWLISHLRGSLYNHTDFYLYPYLILMFFAFRKLQLPAQEKAEKQ